MKKIFFLLALTAGITGLMTTSCKSNTEKNEEAVENVNDANANLKDVQDEAIDDASKKATDAEWQTYKNEMLSAISANEARITDLKNALNKPGTKFDANYSKNIDSLQKRNLDLKIRIENYENNKTDWESFKREFNTDMDGLGKEFDDFIAKNKK
jgi:exonuclease VII large subunit